MELRDLRQSDLDYCRDNDISHSKFDTEQCIYTWTLLEDGDILGIGGLQIITNNCAWVWASLTNNATKYKVTLLRTIRDYMETTCTNAGVTRIQAWSEIGFDKSKRLLEHLGFKPEGEPMVGFVEKNISAQLYVKFIGDS